MEVNAKIEVLGKELSWNEARELYNKLRPFFESKEAEPLEAWKYRLTPVYPIRPHPFRPYYNDPLPVPICTFATSTAGEKPVFL